MWKEIIKNNHCGYNENVNYAKLLKQNPIKEKDLKFFERVIDKSMNGSNVDYDMFTENGGIDIAAILLAEVKRLKG